MRQINAVRSASANNPAALAHQRPPPVLVLVDDDPAVRHAVSFAFEASGIAVTTFADAESALAAAGQEAWRCLVLDQNLPGMNGLDLLERLRAAGVQAPTILITTHPSRATRARAFYAGVEIVEKPLLDNQLSRLVRDIMTGTSA